MSKPRAATYSPEPPAPDIGPFRAQHLAVAQRQMMTEFGRATVIVDESESPLAWLARRRGRNGRAMIEAHQLQAGERLRADFTFANLTPRTTSNGAPSPSFLEGRRKKEGLPRASQRIGAAERWLFEN